MKRWVILFSGVILQTILGGIYAWSEFAVPLVENYGLTRAQTGQIFGLTIAVFALSMNPAARLLHRIGPRLTASLGVMLYSLGYLTAAQAEGRFFLLLLGFGILIGSGIGFGYVCPLTVSMKWFPDKKGLVTGIAVGGFGAGAIIMSNIAEYLMQHQGYSLSELFRFLAVYPGIIAMIVVQTFSEPVHKHDDSAHKGEEAFKKILVSRDFMLILLGMFSGTFAGLLVIGNLKPMMLASGLEESAASLCISLFAAGNITGRILWGRISDHLETWQTVLLAEIYFALSICLMAATGSNQYLLLFTCFAVGLGFGSCFVIYASAVARLYGVRLFGKLYPVVFAAYGFAALTGPQTGGWLADFTGAYTWGILIGLKLIVLSAVAILWSCNCEHVENLRARFFTLRSRAIPD